MEIKYKIVLFIGIVTLIFLIVSSFRQKQQYKSGKKISGMNGLEESDYFKKKMHIYNILRRVMSVALLAAIMISFVLLSRPYVIKKEKKDEFKRDIILCMDVSTSVDELNKQLTKRLKETVSQLKGERFGIVIFNTSGVMICPLTDDYEYVMQVLDEVNNCIGVADEEEGRYESDWLYRYNYLFGGTLIGAEERGSSLIGDGLATAVCDFPDANEDRSRIVILSTDNDLQGTPYMTLDEAAGLCKEKKVTVFGIGTKAMTDQNKQTMNSAMNKTGGKFYTQEESGTVDKIVDDISRQSKSLINGKAVVNEIPIVTIPIVLLDICFVAQLVVFILLKGQDKKAYIRQIVAIVLLLIINLRPMISDKNATYTKQETDTSVVFVIDNTISMLAQDYGGTNERLQGVKEDCANIVNELDGARFSVIAFDNTARLLVPFSNDTQFVTNTIESLKPPISLYARGSSLNIWKDNALQQLKEAKDKGRKSVIFFISDGENTSEEKLDSFKELSKYADYGAVLGYGTAEGGIMETDDWDDGTKEAIEDPDDYSKAALSKIDEENLRQIADDMKVKYINMNNKNGLQKMINGISDGAKKSSTKSKTQGRKDIFYLFLIPFLILLVFGYVDYKRER